MKVAWTPGPWAALVVEGGGLLSDVALDSARRAAVLEELHQANVDGVVALLRDPLEWGLSWCAVVALDGSGAVVALWGEAKVLLGVGGRALVVRGTGTQRWSRTVVPAADGAVLGDPLLPKSACRVVTDSSLDAGSVRLGSAAPRRGSAGARRDVVDVHATLVELPSETTDVAGQVHSPSPQAAIAAEPAPRSEVAFDELWGRTVARPVEEAAVREVEDLDRPTAGPAEPTVSGNWDVAPAPPVATNSMSEPARSVAPPMLLPAFDGLAEPGAIHDGLTLPRTALVEDATCRVVASFGASVDLATSVTIGRVPEAAGPGAAVLAVPRRFGDVSRSHLRLARMGLEVSAVDLGSNNGSVLARPDGVRESLVPGVPVPFGRGDVVTIGEDVSIRLEFGGRSDLIR